jgi:hypothetical protein
MQRRQTKKIYDTGYNATEKKRMRRKDEEEEGKEYVYEERMKEG